jgi:hypothetical protein
MKHFEALKQDLKKDTAPRGILIQQPTKGTGTRADKKTVAGHYSPDVKKTLNIMAADEGSTLQALLGEAIDLLMRQRGKHPFGER